MDNGNRNVGVTTYSNFCKSDHKEALKKAVTYISELCDGHFQQVEHGHIVVVVDPELNPNIAMYRLPFLVAEVIDSNVAQLDTTLPETELVVQIFRPCDLHSITIAKSFLWWQGDDSRLWCPTVQRSSIKMIDLTPRSKKLTSKSI